MAGSLRHGGKMAENGPLFGQVSHLSATFAPSWKRPKSISWPLFFPIEGLTPEMGSIPGNQGCASVSRVQDSRCRENCSAEAERRGAVPAKFSGQRQGCDDFVQQAPNPQPNLQNSTSAGLLTLRAQRLKKSRS